MKKLSIKFLVFIAFLFSIQNTYSQCCTITLDTYDSFGDGWNGGSLEVFIDGVSQGTYAAAGSGTTFTFSVCDGDVFELNYTSGFGEIENSYQLSNTNGTIFSDGPPPTTGMVFSANDMCSIEPPPSCK